MIDTHKTRRLARDYLSAVDKVFAAVRRAKQLRDALARTVKGNRRAKQPEPR